MKLFKSFFARMAAASVEREQVEAELGSNYTPRVREVFALAEEEAARLNHNFIDTEHVLLGLVKLGQGVAANVLKRQGVNLEKARAAVEESVGRGPDITIVHPIPFTQRVKRVLVRAQ